MADLKYVLALDQGTTSSRAILFDRSGTIVASQAYEFAQHYPKPGWDIDYSYQGGNAIALIPPARGTVIVLQ